MEPLTVAIEAAHQAGELILQRFRKPQEVRAKGPQDIVTEADLEAEEAIVRCLRKAFPETSSSVRRGIERPQTLAAYG